MVFHVCQGKQKKLEISGPNTSREPMEMSIPQLNSMRKPAMIYILVTSMPTGEARWPHG